jgi:hypothetical protein
MKMEIRPDMVIINVSPAQKEMLRNPKHAKYVEAIILDLENGIGHVFPSRTRQT